MLKLSVNGYESILPFHLNFIDRNKKLEHFSYALHGQRTTHSRSTRRRCKAVGTEIAICVSFFFLFFSRFDFTLDIYVYVYIYLHIQGASQYVEPTAEVNREHKNNEKSSHMDISPIWLSFEFITTLTFQ